MVHSQRTRLLDAAVHVAGSDGYAAMTVSAVIARAGVSRKTFYEFFADREDCFLAAYELVVARGLAGFRDAWEIGESWPDRVRGALTWALDTLASHPDEARMGFVEVLAAGPRALQRRDAALREFTRFLEPGYRSSGDDRSIPALMPEAIAGAIFEVIHARLLRGDAADLPRLLPDLVYCTLAPFLGPAEAAEQAALGPLP